MAKWFHKSQTMQAELREALFRDGHIDAPTSPAQGKHCVGVVVEVGMQEGLDLLAAYDDYTARYYNFSGSGVVWEHPDTSLDLVIDELLANGQAISDHTGTWEGKRPGPAAAGAVRINVLTPGGLHFGEGSMDALSRDALAGPAIATATVLMQQLIAKVPKNAS
jgi:hypothetical protein